MGNGKNKVDTVTNTAGADISHYSLENDFFSSFGDKLETTDPDHEYQEKQLQFIEENDLTKKADVPFFQKMLNNEKLNYNQLIEDKSRVIDNYSIMEIDPTGGLGPGYELQRKFEQLPLNMAQINLAAAEKHNRKIEIIRFLKSVKLNELKDFKKVLYSDWILENRKVLKIESTEALIFNINQEDYIDDKSILNWIGENIGEESISEAEFKEVQTYLQLQRLDKATKKNAIAFNQIFEHIAPESRHEQVKLINDIFQEKTKEFLTEDEIELQRVNLEIMEVKEKLRSLSEGDPDYQTQQMYLSRLYIEREKHISKDQLWFDENGNVVDKEEDSDQAMTKGINREYSKLEELAGRNDFGKLQMEFFHVFNKYKTAEELKSAAKNNFKNSYHGANKLFHENTKDLFYQTKALAIFLSTQEDPSKLETFGFFSSIGEGFVEAVTGDDRTILSNRELVNDLIPSLQKLGLLREVDVERAKGTTGERYGYIIGQATEAIVEMIIVEAVTLGLGIELAVARVFVKLKRLTKSSKQLNRVVSQVEKLTPYILQEAKFHMVGESYGTASAEMTLEKLFEKSALNRFLSRRMGKWGTLLLKAPIKGTSEFVIETGASLATGELDLMNVTQEDKEQLIVAYGIALLFGLVKPGKFDSKTKFEELMVDLESNDPLVNHAKKMISEFESDDFDPIVLASFLGGIQNSLNSFLQLDTYSSLELEHQFNRDEFKVREQTLDRLIKIQEASRKDPASYEQYSTEIIETVGHSSFQVKFEKIDQLQELIAFLQTDLDQKRKAYYEGLTLNEILEEEGVNSEFAKDVYGTDRSLEQNLQMRNDLINGLKLPENINEVGELIGKHYSEVDLPKGYQTQKSKTGKMYIKRERGKGNNQQYVKLELDENGFIQYAKDNFPKKQNLELTDQDLALIDEFLENKDIQKLGSILIESVEDLRSVFINFRQYTDYTLEEVLDRMLLLVEHNDPAVFISLTNQLKSQTKNIFKGGEWVFTDVTNRGAEFIKLIEGVEVRFEGRVVDIRAIGTNFEYKNWESLAHIGSLADQIIADQMVSSNLHGDRLGGLDAGDKLKFNRYVFNNKIGLSRHDIALALTEKILERQGITLTVKTEFSNLYQDLIEIIEIR